MIITLEDQLEVKSSALEKACKTVQYFITNQKVLEKELNELRLKLEVSLAIHIFLSFMVWPFLFQQFSFSLFQGNADSTSADAVSEKTFFSVISV